MRRSNKEDPGVAPEAQRQHLLAWLKEWDLFERARADEGPESAAAASAGDGKLPDIPEEPLWSQPAPVVDEPFPAVGHIRLLQPDLVPHVSTPMYCAVLADWEGDLLLVSLFSPFFSPATRGEFLTGRAEYPLRVLCPWSAVTLLPVLVARSWYVDKLSAKELKTATQVFHHTVTGAPLPKALLDHVGVPIIHPFDPRIDYQRMLAAVMAPLVQRTAAWVEAEAAVADALADWQAPGSVSVGAVSTSFWPPVAAAAFGAWRAWGKAKKFEPLPMAAGKPARCQMLVAKRARAAGKLDLTPAGSAQLMNVVTGRLKLIPTKQTARSLRACAGELVRLVNAKTGDNLGQGLVMQIRESGAMVVDLTGVWQSTADKATALSKTVLIVVKE